MIRAACYSKRPAGGRLEGEVLFKQRSAIDHTSTGRAEPLSRQCLGGSPAYEALQAMAFINSDDMLAWENQIDNLQCLKGWLASIHAAHTTYW
jgi:hypothetical protein